MHATRAAKACTALLTIMLVGCSMQRSALEIRPAATMVGMQDSGAAALIAAGRDQLRAQNFGLAVSSFREALIADPDSAAAHNGLGIAYASIGRDDLARRFFERAIAFAPEDESYRRNLERFAATSAPDAPDMAKTDAPDTLQMADVSGQLAPEAGSPVDYRQEAALTVSLATGVGAPPPPAVRLASGVTGATLVTRIPPPAPMLRARIESVSVAAARTELKRVSRYEVRIAVRPSADRLGERMKRDYFAQWDGEKPQPATANGQAAFQDAIRSARKRMQLSQTISTRRRACARMQVIAYSLAGTGRGADQCSS